MAVAGLFMVDFFRRFRPARKISSSNGEYSSEWEKNSAKTNVRRNFRAFCYAIAFSFVAILIRCIYRLPEVGSGLILSSVGETLTQSLDGRWLGQYIDEAGKRVPCPGWDVSILVSRYTTC